MLYILLVDGEMSLATVDHTEAQASFATATDKPGWTGSARLLQVQADVVQERTPPPAKPTDGKPLSPAEQRQLADLLARQNANAQKAGA